MRDAFGVQNSVRYSGIIEIDGLPTRPRLKNAAHIKPEDASATPTPDENGRNSNYGARLDDDGAFALAAASLRQALQDMPEIAEISKHIMIEETKQGLNIEIVDQDGRSMFPEGSKEPYERTRRLVQRLAGAVQGACRTASRSPATPRRRRRRGKPGYGPWELSADRANAVRQILEEEGVPTGALLHGGRPGRHPAAVSRRSLRRRQPPRHHHADARGAAACRRASSLDLSSGSFSRATVAVRRRVVFAGAGV